MKNTKSVVCHCGGISGGHNIGDERCFREIVPEDKKPVQAAAGNDRWLVDGHWITGFSLREQRGYYQHPCGNWSRPKDHDSVNSIEA